MPAFGHCPVRPAEPLRFLRPTGRTYLEVEVLYTHGKGKKFLKTEGMAQVTAFREDVEGHVLAQ
jgi:hypothetical protein